MLQKESSSSGKSSKRSARPRDDGKGRRLQYGARLKTRGRRKSSQIPCVPSTVQIQAHSVTTSADTCGAVLERTHQTQGDSRLQEEGWGSGEMEQIIMCRVNCRKNCPERLLEGVGKCGLRNKEN